MVYKRTVSIQGSLNPNWKGGKSRCSSCSKLLSERYSKPKQCRVCFLDNLRKNAKGSVYPSCVNCSAMTRDYKSILCKNCYRGALRPSWKGGISRTQSLIRNTPLNRQWIKQCMYRDNYTCQDCGITPIKSNMLEVHHIKSFASILKDYNVKSVEDSLKCEELWNMDNGITLCKECHKLTDSYSKKIN